MTGLTNGTAYTFTVSATNALGTGPASSVSAQATPEASAPTCPCTLFGSSTPPMIDAGDGSSVNLGVRFTVDTSGFITGLRFYKAAANVGTHVGTLYSDSGAVLATANFTGETASGWQQVTFSSAVAVTPGVTYIAAYLAPYGHYSVTANGFGTAVVSPPLYGVATGVEADGVYAYGSTAAFPTNTYNATNYWVDVIFSLTSH